MRCVALVGILGGLMAVPGFAQEFRPFVKARPVWVAGRETEMNLLVGFRATFEAQDEKPVLRVAAATIYRVWVNGQYAGYGPARGPHGWYRIDEWDISDKTRPGRNLVAAEVAGYNCNSYYLLDQPSFFQAEVVAGEKVLAATGDEGAGFSASILPHRVQKVQRYSFQRPFIEVYRLSQDSDTWRAAPPKAIVLADLAIQPEKKLLPRGVLLPEYQAIRKPVRLLSQGRTEPAAETKEIWKDRSLMSIGPKLKGYPENELQVIPSTEAQRILSRQTASLNRPYDSDSPLTLPANTYQILDFGVNSTGFLKAKVRCRQKSRIWFLFDEILSGDDVDFRRLSCVNIVDYELEPGDYDLETIEPYTLRYLKLLCLQGQCRLTDVSLRECAHPATRRASFSCSDQRLNRLYAAAVETFRQNALDIFMDCPSRERAGWLCDSLFTARVACDLTGETRVERNFFENFLLPERFPFLPDGMLPMCYPADHNDGVFIPNWALWFVLQLEEYAQRSGDRNMVERLRPRIAKLLEYFTRFENSDGLLEKLESWVFVEWSKANEFVQDVNYPTNMLYAGALSAAARLYEMPELASKAERIRQTIRKQSFDGQFFVDNAVRKDGLFQVTRNRSEVCQYFAFFFGVASPTTHPQLWETLRDQFGPDREKRKAFPEIHPANSFIGNTLRMEILSAAGGAQQILDESIAYLLYMADQTGTLWENVGAYASCNHGFASHAVHTLYRDVLGLYAVDRPNRRVQIRFNELRLDWCEGTMPVGDGAITLRWWKTPEGLAYRLTLPTGWQAQVDNLSGRSLQQIQ